MRNVGSIPAHKTAPRRGLLGENSFSAVLKPLSLKASRTAQKALRRFPDRNGACWAPGSLRSAPPTCRAISDIADVTNDRAFVKNNPATPITASNAPLTPQEITCASDMAARFTAFTDGNWSRCTSVGMRRISAGENSEPMASRRNSPIVSLTRESWWRSIRTVKAAIINARRRSTAIMACREFHRSMKGPDNKLIIPPSPAARPRNPRLAAPKRDEAYQYAATIRATLPIWLRNWPPTKTITERDIWKR